MQCSRFASRLSFKSTNTNVVRSRQSPFAHRTRESHLSHRLFTSSSSSQPGVSFIRSRIVPIGFATASAIGGLAYLYLTPGMVSWSRKDPRSEVPVPEIYPPPPDFEHPYSSRWWVIRAAHKIARMIHLIWMFTPVAVVLLIHRAKPDDPYWRKYYLEILIDTMQASGCAFQKFGQWLSMRPDCFYPDTIEALSHLHSHVVPHHIEHTRQVIRDSFGLELEDIFESFDPEPVASGTIGQVHRAVLRDDIGRGPARDVAVKIRHPKVLDQTWLDLDIIWSVCDSTGFMRLPFRRSDWVKSIQRQIDFQWEAHYLSCFRRNFHDEVQQGTLRFPDVVTDLLSASVLIESWEPGKQVSKIFSQLGKDFMEVKKHSFSESTVKKKKQLAQTMFDFSVKCFVRDNLAHGDLHGGNVLYDDQTCTILDAGLTTSLGRDVKNNFFNFINSICSNRPDETFSYVMMFQDPLAGPGISEERQKALRTDIKKVVNEYSVTPGEGEKEMLLGDCCGQLFILFQRYQLTLRSDVASSIITLSVCEGLIKMLDPTFDIVKRVLPYLARYRQSGGYVDEHGNYLP